MKLTIAQTDAWQSYETDSWEPYEKNKNKQYPIPEPSTYGFMIGASILFVFFMKKYFKKK